MRLRRLDWNEIVHVTLVDASAICRKFVNFHTLEAVR